MCACLCHPPPPPHPRRPLRHPHPLQAAAWTPAGTKQELTAAGGKKVVELDGQRVLLIEQDGAVYALSNKCSHLGLPLVSLGGTTCRAAGGSAGLSGSVSQRQQQLSRLGTAAWAAKASGTNGSWLSSRLRQCLLTPRAQIETY